MQFLDRTGVGTLWSMCKTKFALAGHTHNYAGSGSPGGSANSAIGVVDYNQTGKTIQIGYSGTGITGDQIKYIAGYTDGSGNINAKIKDVSKDALKSWLGLGSLAYSSSSIPTKLSQLNNDKGFVTGSVSGNTVTINGASTTWTNTWRGIQDNLTSSSTSESLSANQGRVLKGLIDNKANSSDLSSYSQKDETVKNISVVTRNTQIGVSKQFIRALKADGVATEVAIIEATVKTNGLMSASDKMKLNGIQPGANNYTLPTASVDTLGGIKASSPYIGGYNFPICVDEDNRAYTRISGLDSGERGGGITQVTVSDDDDTNFSTKYTRDKITVYRNTEGEASLRFPFKSGTFALTSDIPSIPDVSNLCKFNFVNSISDCVNGRINFLFKNSNDYVDLSFLQNLEEGTILLIYCPHTGFQITCKPCNWYYNGTKVAAYDTMYVDKAKLVLAFFYNIYAYVSTFSY